MIPIDPKERLLSQFDAYVLDKQSELQRNAKTDAERKITRAHALNKWELDGEDIDVLARCEKGPFWGWGMNRRPSEQSDA